MSKKTNEILNLDGDPNRCVYKADEKSFLKRFFKTLKIMEEIKAFRKIKGSSSEPITQMYYEFRQWKECFATWRRNLPLYGNAMQLVISTHQYTSGYYIEERGKELTQTDICYVGKEVDKLEKRIIKEHEKAIKQKRGVRFIT